MGVFAFFLCLALSEIRPTLSLGLVSSLLGVGWLFPTALNAGLAKYPAGYFAKPSVQRNQPTPRNSQRIPRSLCSLARPPPLSVAGGKVCPALRAVHDLFFSFANFYFFFFLAPKTASNPHDRFNRPTARAFVQVLSCFCSLSRKAFNRLPINRRFFTPSDLPLFCLNFEFSCRCRVVVPKKFYLCLELTKIA